MEGKGLRGSLVIIDPGHGGEDQGDREASGVGEADLCWDIANRLAVTVGSAGARVRFTRTETEGPDASERARRANEADGDIFLSLHLNSHSEPIAEGASTYYFPRSRRVKRLRIQLRTGWYTSACATAGATLVRIRSCARRACPRF